jgi:excisionase family DNA binding protein
MSADSIDTSAEWISLHEASERLGVATATLRRWADAGKIPIKRTLGGHRRFLASAIEQLAATATSQAAAPAVPAPARRWGVDHQELSRQDWHVRLASKAHSEHLRGLGQRLLGLLIQYLNRQPEEERLLAEARMVGVSYGREARASEIGIYDTIEAFLFFRSSFAQMAMPGIAQPADTAEALFLHTRIQRFMDATLLGTIRGYEEGE